MTNTKIKAEKRAGSETGAPVKNSPAMMEVIAQIARHRVAMRMEVRSGQLTLDMGHSTPDGHRKLRVLVQALGNVGEGLELIENYPSQSSTEELRYDLLALAANTVAWLEAIEEAEK